MPDFSRQEKLEQEKVIVGFYISDHPLDTKKHLIRKLFTTPLNELNTLPDGTRTKILGITTEYKERIAKTSGNPIGILKIMDKENSIEVMFAGKYLMSMTDNEKQLLKTEGNIVLITLDIKKTKKIYTDQNNKSDSNSNEYIIYFAQGIEILDEKSSNEFKDIKIKIYSSSAIKELKKELNTINNGKSRITLLIKKEEELIDGENTNNETIDEDNNDKYTTLRLSETYFITEKFLTETVAKIPDLEIVY